MSLKLLLLNLASTLHAPFTVMQQSRDVGRRRLIRPLILMAGDLSPSAEKSNCDTTISQNLQKSTGISVIYCVYNHRQAPPRLSLIEVYHATHSIHPPFCQSRVAGIGLGPFLFLNN
jgi:hypothetical protein